jgi:molybdopterin-guanine dinucleotide biosynthesis protein A
VLNDVVVIAKSDTELPGLPGVTVWIEPEQVTHPLVGITQALVLGDGRSVLVCAVDLPFVSSALIERLAAADPLGAPAVVAAADGVMQPLLGCYQPQAGALLLGSGGGFDRPLGETVAALAPRLLEVDDPQQLFNVNSPYDLLQAAAILERFSRR